MVPTTRLSKVKVNQREKYSNGAVPANLAGSDMPEGSGAKSDIDDIFVESITEERVRALGEEWAEKLWAVGKQRVDIFGHAQTSEDLLRKLFKPVGINMVRPVSDHWTTAPSGLLGALQGARSGFRLAAHLGKLADKSGQTVGKESAPYTAQNQEVSLDAKDEIKEKKANMDIVPEGLISHGEDVGDLAEGKALTKEELSAQADKIEISANHEPVAALEQSKTIDVDAIDTYASTVPESVEGSHTSHTPGENVTSTTGSRATVHVDGVGPTVEVGHANGKNLAVMEQESISQCMEHGSPDKNDRSTNTPSHIDCEKDMHTISVPDVLEGSAAPGDDVISEVGHTVGEHSTPLAILEPALSLRYSPNKMIEHSATYTHTHDGKEAHANSVSEELEGTEIPEEILGTNARAQMDMPATSGKIGQMVDTERTPLAAGEQELSMDHAQCLTSNNDKDAHGVTEVVGGSDSPAGVKIGQILEAERSPLAAMEQATTNAHIHEKHSLHASSAMEVMDGSSDSHANVEISQQSAEERMAAVRPKDLASRNSFEIEYGAGLDANEEARTIHGTQDEVEEVAEKDPIKFRTLDTTETDSEFPAFWGVRGSSSQHSEDNFGALTNLDKSVQSAADKPIISFEAYLEEKEKEENSKPQPPKELLTGFDLSDSKFDDGMLSRTGRLWLLVIYACYKEGASGACVGLNDDFDKTLAAEIFKSWPQSEQYGTTIGELTQQEMAALLGMNGTELESMQAVACAHIHSDKNGVQIVLLGVLEGVRSFVEELKVFLTEHAEEDKLVDLRGRDLNHAPTDDWAESLKAVEEGDVMPEEQLIPELTPRGKGLLREIEKECQEKFHHMMLHENRSHHESTRSGPAEWQKSFNGLKLMGQSAFQRLAKNLEEKINTFHVAGKSIKATVGNISANIEQETSLSGAEKESSAELSIGNRISESMIAVEAENTKVEEGVEVSSDEDKKVSEVTDLDKTASKDIVNSEGRAAGNKDERAPFNLGDKFSGAKAAVGRLFSGNKESKEAIQTEDANSASVKHVAEGSGVIQRAEEVTRGAKSSCDLLRDAGFGVDNRITKVKAHAYQPEKFLGVVAPDIVVPPGMDYFIDNKDQNEASRAEGIYIADMSSTARPEVTSGEGTNVKPRGGAWVNKEARTWKEDTRSHVSVAYEEELRKVFAPIDASNGFFIDIKTTGASSTSFNGYITSECSRGLLSSHTYIDAITSFGRTRMSIISSPTSGVTKLATVTLPEVTRDELTGILVNMLQEKGAIVEVSGKEEAPENKNGLKAFFSNLKIGAKDAVKKVQKGIETFGKKVQNSRQEKNSGVKSTPQTSAVQESFEAVSNFSILSRHGHMPPDKLSW